MGLFNFVKNLLPSVDDIKKTIFGDAQKPMRFEVGEGLSNTTTVLPGPRVSTVEAIKRGEDIKVVKPTEPTKVAPKTVAKATVQKSTQIAKVEEEQGMYKKSNAEVAKDIFLSYPKKVAQVGKVIAQAPGRAVTSVGLEAPAAILSLIQNKKVEAKYTPKTTFEKMVFGEEPIRGIFTEEKDAEKKSNELLQKIGIDKNTAAGMSLALAPLFVGGLKAIDIIPIGGGKKAGEKIFTDIAKSKNPVNIARNLAKFGVEDAKLADDLIKVTNPAEVKNIIGQTLTKTTPQSVIKNIDTIGDELNTKMVDQTFRSDKLNLPEEMTKEVEKRLSALGLEQRTVKTFGEMGDAALELGADPKTLLKDVATNRITDAQIIALRNTINNNEQFISQALERIRKNPEMEDILMGQIDNASAQIDQALGKLVKGGTEAGRAVVAFKILARNTLDPVFWMTKLKRVLGGKEVTPEMQRIIFDLTAKKDINGLANYVAMNIGSTFSEKAVTLWKAGLLTSPTTHMANVTGNVTMRALMDASDVVALPLDVMASLITGKRTKIVNPSTITAEISGALKGVKEAGRYMWTGNYSDEFLRKWDLPKQINFKNKILDTYTKTIFKSLGAEDVVFRKMATEKALSEQAQLIAKNEKLSGNAFKVRVKELLTAPTNEMVLDAIDVAEYATFQSKSAIGDAVVGAKRALARNDSLASKAGLVGLEIVTPFVKTPTNIISRIVDFSPAGFIKAIVKAVNPATRSQKAIVEDLSRAITGSGVMALGYLLAEQGILLGGTPENAKERATEYYKAQPSSILINGEWRELKRVSPVGNILIMGADIYDMYQNQGKRGVDLGSSIAFSGVKNLTEQSFLQGVSGALDALMSPDRSAEKFTKQTVASLVPSIVTRIAKSIDPTLRGSDNIVQAFQERLPILREKLAPVRDIFGEIAKVPAGKNYWFDPFSSKIDKSSDPVIKELTVLKHPIGMPEKTIDGVKMNSYEYSEYQRYNGKMLKPVLTALISSDEYQTLNSDEKKQVIDQAITTIRQGINDTVFPALMMVRYNLDKDTDPGVLRELMRQLDNRPGYRTKNDDEKATIIKKFLYGLKDQL